LLSGVRRLSKFIEEVLLPSLPQNIVIFIDEIESVKSLDLPTDDFFALLRACYDKRADQPEYRRLTFALLGVTPRTDLISDKNRTPFNMGRAIQLNNFELHEAMSLAQGLASKTGNVKAVLEEVLAWTGGQPFLTQKVCQLVLSASEPIPTDAEAEWVEELIQNRVIKNWEVQDEPEHLKTISDRFLCSQQPTGRLLTLYDQIWQQGEIQTDDSPEQMELLLSGLVLRQAEKLRVSNRIYQSIFNQNWVDTLRRREDQVTASLEQVLARAAQDIKNPIAFMYNNLRVASEYVPDLLELLNLYAKHYPHPVSEILDKAEEIDLEFVVKDLPKLLSSLKLGAERSQQLVLRLKNFSRCFTRLPQQWQAQWFLEDENAASLCRALIDVFGGRIVRNLPTHELDSWQEYKLLAINHVKGQTLLP
jgi:hypothetical protein